MGLAVFWLTIPTVKGHDRDHPQLRGDGGGSIRFPHEAVGIDVERHWGEVWRGRG